MTNNAAGIPLASQSTDFAFSQKSPNYSLLSGVGGHSLFDSLSHEQKRNILSNTVFLEISQIIHLWPLDKKPLQ